MSAGPTGSGPTGAGPKSAGATGAPGPSRPRLDPSHVVDVFVYVVVLNLAVEYAPKVLAESFTVSLLTAVLLKLVLEVVLLAKNAARRRLAAASTALGRVVAVAMLVVVLPGSKLLVLEVVHLVFGDRVSLGGFFPVTGLIVLLLVSRYLVRRLLALGRTA